MGWVLSQSARPSHSLPAPSATLKV
jgi:hypothetical protein